MLNSIADLQALFAASSKSGTLEQFIGAMRGYDPADVTVDAAAGIITIPPAFTLPGREPAPVEMTGEDVDALAHVLAGDVAEV